MKILIGGIRVCGKLPPLLSPMVTWSSSLCAPGSSFSPFFLGLHSPVSYIQYLFLALLLYAFSSRNSHFPLIAASATMFFFISEFFLWNCIPAFHCLWDTWALFNIQDPAYFLSSFPNIHIYTWIPLSLFQLPASTLWNHFDFSLSNLEEKFSVIKVHI